VSLPLTKQFTVKVQHNNITTAFNNTPPHDQHDIAIVYLIDVYMYVQTLILRK